jgi:microcystin-dependent protein
MEGFVGEIRLFTGNYVPDGWALCDGSLLPIGPNQALFSLLGTTYGGDGVNTFGVPDLRGRLPIHQGSGPNLTPRALGQTFGSETVTLTASQLPVHTHSMAASTATAELQPPTNAVPAATPTATTRSNMYAAAGTAVALHPSAVQNAGAGTPHSNLMPALCATFMIALTGVYPPQP